MKMKCSTLYCLLFTLILRVYCRRRGNAVDENTIGSLKDGNDIWKTLCQCDCTNGGHPSKEIKTWPDANIPYIFDDSVEAGFRPFIDEIVKYFHKVSCVSVRPKTSDDKDYVIVKMSKKVCSSMIGCIGGPQVITLNEHCISRGHILRQFFHTAGFDKQQNSHDREKYVKVMLENVLDEHKSEFVKRSESRRRSGDSSDDYDYYSIMHSGTFAFSKNGKPTIEPINNEVATSLSGKITTFSPNDIIKLRKLYNCESEHP